MKNTLKSTRSLGVLVLKVKMRQPDFIVSQQPPFQKAFHLYWRTSWVYCE